ncbi:hypothetical protein O206_22550 [Ochrobactrum sp. EGD-AQ16]|nr:hypothetical protein O206_22550 [Ochrobactrum sp. EGD-AQ16]
MPAFGQRIIMRIWICFLQQTDRFSPAGTVSVGEYQRQVFDFLRISDEERNPGIDPFYFGYRAKVQRALDVQ